MDEVATVGIVLCICIPAALLAFRFLEAPMTIWLKDWLSGRKAQSHSPSY